MGIKTPNTFWLFTRFPTLNYSVAAVTLVAFTRL